MASENHAPGATREPLGWPKKELTNCQRAEIVDIIQPLPNDSRRCIAGGRQYACSKKYDKANGFSKVRGTIPTDLHDEDGYACSVRYRFARLQKAARAEGYTIGRTERNRDNLTSDTRAHNLQADA